MHVVPGKVVVEMMIHFGAVTGLPLCDARHAEVGEWITFVFVLMTERALIGDTYPQAYHDPSLES